MRIYEILSWNNNPTEKNRLDRHLNFPPRPFSGDLGNLATAFTRGSLAKHFWNLNGLESQPSGPAPPDAGTELIASGTLGPTTASWQADPVEEELLVNITQRRLVPSFRAIQVRRLT
jgi:hypothetical protein